ncbi:retrovirus-related pol polyprotein from transposon TNT 1-94 [Tanacetum coccineum]
MDTVCFGNDNFIAITGYGDYVQVNLTICHIYYVEGLGQNLFSVGQFCDGDLEVAFRSNTCYFGNLKGEDLLTGSYDFNLYTISISEMAASSLVCLMSKATFKYDKDHLCAACEQRKSKKATFPSKLVSSTNSKLKLLHMDLCGTMMVENVNGKRYILVQVLKIRSDNGTEFKNEKLMSYYEKLGIMHQTSTTRTPQQNGVVEHINRTLVEAARRMLDQKPNVQYFHVFGSLCYPTNDRNDLGKMKPKADIGIFIGYSESLRGFRVYNYRTRKIMETIYVKFDELTSMASECNNSGPGVNCSNFQDSSEEMNAIPSQQDLDNLFGPLYE